MVRLSVELVNDAAQYVNPVRDRELNLRNYKIPVIENMGVTRVSCFSILCFLLVCSGEVSCLDSSV